MTLLNLMFSKTKQTLKILAQNICATTEKIFKMPQQNAATEKDKQNQDFIMIVNTVNKRTTNNKLL